MKKFTPPRKFHAKYLLIISLMLILAKLNAQNIASSPASLVGPIYHMGGNVGFGESSPDQLLHIYAETRPAIRIETYCPTGIFHREYWDFENNEGVLNLNYSNNTTGTFTYFAIGTNGNVGIGTTNPASLLDVAGTITTPGGNSENWNTAFAWGNHATAGYLTSFTETDPLFTTHAASGISTQNITDWNNAFIWGNHSQAGYITDGNMLWENEYGFITANSSETLSNKSGNISMWANDAGYLTSFSENDPKIGANTMNYLSKWNGTQLISSTINEIDNKIGIGAKNPATDLHISAKGTKASLRLESSYDEFGINKSEADLARASWDFRNEGGNLHLDFNRNATLTADRFVFSKEGNFQTLTLSAASNLFRVNADGSVIAAKFSGNGSGLTNLSSAQIENGQYMINSAGNAGQIWTSTGSGRGAWQNLNLPQSSWTLNGTSVYYNTGNVGIGTQNPTANLDIKTILSSPGTYFTQNWGTSFADYGFSLQTVWNESGINQNFVQKYNGTDYNSLAFYAGNVGIGTTNPVTKLEVNGDITFNATLRTPSRMHIAGDELLFLLNKDGVIVGKEWGGNGNLTVEGNSIFQNYTSFQKDIFLLGENPVGSSRDINFQFSSAGSALIRAYRGGNWDTYLQFWTSSAPENNPQVRMQIDGNGNVGIGTGANTLTEKLEVNGNLTVEGALKSAGNHFLVSESELQYHENFRVTSAGYLTARDIVVKLTGWKDNVFYTNYPLMPLDELQNYISVNKHLPGVISEKEVLENGVSLGENQAVLLQKIEELTLYILEQEQQLNEMKKEITNLKNK